MIAAARRLFLAAALGLAATAPAAADSPVPMVEAFQRDLLAVMREARVLSVRKRYERLEPAIARTFHLPVMVRLAAGPAWDGASDEKRRRLIDAFRRVNVSTVATLFDGYDGQVFETTGTRAGPKGTVYVDTRLVDPAGGDTALSYLAKRYGERWLVVDVIVDNGISELRTRRSEYAAILADGGIERLIAVLDDKADELIRQ